MAAPETATATRPAPTLDPALLAAPAPPTTRLLALDVFRGMTVAGMLLVNNPGSWGAQYAYGRAMVCLGDLKEGRHALEIAVARHPNDLDVVFALADCMERQKDIPQIYLLLRNTGAEMRSPEAYCRLATIAEQVNDLDSAKQALDSAIEFDQGFDIAKSTEPYYRMAMLQAKIGNQAEALRRLRQAYGVNPQDPRVRAELEKRGQVLGPTLGLPRGS